MKKSLKKVLASLSVAALIASSSVYNVSAANFSPTLTYTDAGVANDTSDDTLLIQVPENANTSNGQTVTVYIKDKNGTAVDLTNFDVANTTNAANAAITDAANGVVTFDVTTASSLASITLTAKTSATFTKQTYSVNVVATNGAGSAVFNPLSANNVLVSATVVPVLNFSLSANSLALGELSTTAYKASSVQVNLTSNANGGVSVNMKSNGLVEANSKKEIGQNQVNAAVHTATTQTTGNDFYRYAVSNSAVTNDATFTAVTTAAGSAQDAVGTIAATDFATDADTAGVTVVGLATPGTVTKHVAIGSEISATTEAGNYSDTLTFTVSGTF